MLTGTVTPLVIEGSSRSVKVRETEPESTVGTTVTIGFGPERVVALRRREALQVGTD